jgi:hypothetical protein
MTENPYAPPNAALILEPQSDLIGELKSQSTWVLVGLGLITYGIYFAHYSARQSKILNRHLGTSAHIPGVLIVAFMFVSYVSLLFFPTIFLFEENHLLVLIGDVIDLVWFSLILIWGFYARNKFNKLVCTSSADDRWLSAFWTFLFTPYYFNYKINKINKQREILSLAQY